MKKILTLSLIAVCMTVFTSMASTTATTEQKQKTEVVSDVTILSNSASVVLDFQPVMVFTDVIAFDKTSVIVSQADSFLALADASRKSQNSDDPFHRSNSLDKILEPIIKPSRS